VATDRRPSSTGALGAGEAAPKQESGALEPAPPARSRLGVWQLVGVVMTAVGVLLLLFFVYLYGFTTLVGNRNQHQLAASLTGNPRALYGLVESRPLTEGQPVALLEIPALHLHQVVVWGTSATDLTRGPGLEPGTALPGEGGTAVIAGRRVTYGGAFGGLGGLEPGNIVRTVDGAGTFSYRVVSAKAVSGSPLVIGPTRANELLLVTSDSSVLPGGKLMIEAELVGQPSPLTPQRNGVRPVRLDLGGASGAGLLAIVWSLLFFAVAITTVWASRRWGRTAVAYRLAVPILLVCGLLACENLAQWLPATL
jgi:LPXTG-site transpeptidase (sortase) family protein